MAANHSQNVSAPSTVTEIRDASPMVQLQGQLQANEPEIQPGTGDCSSESQGGRLPGATQSGQCGNSKLADLTRGYDQSKANYDDLLKKKN